MRRVKQAVATVLVALASVVACGGQTSAPPSPAPSGDGGGDDAGNGDGGGGGDGGGSNGDGGAADRCTLPVDPGPCDAAMPRYYFLAAIGKCVPFVYGGCQGNANNFMSAEACVAACAAGAAHPCAAIDCGVNEECVYRGAKQECARTCDKAGGCPPPAKCGCASSCPSCKDCVNVCLAP